MSNLLDLGNNGNSVFDVSGYIAIYQNNGRIPGELARVHIYNALFNNVDDAKRFIDSAVDRDIERISKFQPGVEKKAGRLGSYIDIFFNGQCCAYYEIKPLYSVDKAEIN